MQTTSGLPSCSHALIISPCVQLSKASLCSLAYSSALSYSALMLDILLPPISSWLPEIWFRMPLLQALRLSRMRIRAPASSSCSAGAAPAWFYPFSRLVLLLPPQAVFSKVCGISAPSCSSNKEMSTCMIFSIFTSFSNTCTTSLKCMNDCLYLLITFLYAFVPCGCFYSLSHRMKAFVSAIIYSLLILPHHYRIDSC